MPYLRHDNVHTRRLTLKLMLRISLAANREEQAAKLVEQCCVCAASLVGQPERRLLPPLPTTFWRSLDDEEPSAPQTCTRAPWPAVWPASVTWFFSALRWRWRMAFG